MREMGFEPMRIAPLDLEANSLTTRTLPQADGKAIRLRERNPADPRIGSDTPAMSRQNLLSAVV